MINIKINDKFKFLSKENVATINKMMEFISNVENIRNELFCELTIIGPRTSRKMNREFRNKDYITDIITFSFFDSKSSIITPLLGEMFLCKNKVIAQSIEYNHSIERELMFLISHGVYHLLGYDHQTKSDEKQMMDKQYNVLEYLNIGR